MSTPLENILDTTLLNEEILSFAAKSSYFCRNILTFPTSHKRLICQMCSGTYVVKWSDDDCFV